MITYIIGENSSGKTTLLESMYNKDIDAVCNWQPTLQNTYNEKNLVDIEYLTDLNIYINGSSCSVESAADDQDHSQSFANIVRILLTEYDSVYLDEPESGLSVYELRKLLIALEYLSDKKDIFITTHTDLVVTARNSKVINTSGENIATNELFRRWLC